MTAEVNMKTYKNKLDKHKKWFIYSFINLFMHIYKICILEEYLLYYASSKCV